MDYSFPLPGDDGKGKTTADGWQIEARAKLAARRAETFVEPSSLPVRQKKQLLCVLCVSVVKKKLICSVPKFDDLVIDPGKQRAGQGTQCKSIGKTDDTYEKGNLVPDKKLAQELKVWADDIFTAFINIPAFNYQPIGCDK